jgi:hypothetical protein
VIGGAAPAIETMRPTDDYEYVLDCPDSAFETAARTLEARITAASVDAPEVQAWTAAQDQVFANCGKPAAVIPPPLDAGAPALARADRDYQIAAAHFYARHWDDAGARFLAIAGDAQSPWRNWGRYLAGRTALRQATLGDTAATAPALERAEQHFQAVLADPALADRHAAARGLLRLTAIHARPAEALIETAAGVAGPTVQAPFARALVDYRYLFAKLPADTLTSDVVRADDLSDWIVTLRNGELSLDEDALAPDPERTASAAERAIGRWRATTSLPWLAASLMLVAPEHADATELARAAAAVPPTSSAWPTLAFHRVRLLLAADQVAPARQLLAEIRRGPAMAIRSFDNLLRAAELRVASTLDELVAASVRHPVGDRSFQEYVASDHSLREPRSQTMRSM